MYRFKHLVTVAAKDDIDQYLAEDAGSPQAGKRSVSFAKSLSRRRPMLNPSKSFKELYNETKSLMIFLDANVLLEMSLYSK